MQTLQMFQCYQWLICCMIASYYSTFASVYYRVRELIDSRSLCQKIPPPENFLHFFQHGWEFLDQILHTYYTFLSTMDYKFVSNYLQFWRSYDILTATTQFTPYVQKVHHRPKRMLAFSDIFPKQFGIFVDPNFTHLLHVPTDARQQIFIQLSPTVTKLCHIKCDH